ncbi:MAG: single-stranded DNA-binding protein [Chloroflexota bacterium]|nr:single-stranded DNA-binding protein [Chloroflexota bacterium]
MYQQLTIVGNLGNDPELKHLADGTPVTNFSVAVDRRWTNKNGDPGKETTWFRVGAWRKLAEPCNEYLKKGRRVMVVGRVSTRAYQAGDGEPRAVMEIAANTVKFLDGVPVAEDAAPDAEGEEAPF